MRSHEARKKKRRQLRHDASIVAEGRLVALCQVRDVSEGGARLVLDAEMELPKEFDLILTRNGRVRRRCLSVWSDGVETGVCFADC